MLNITVPNININYIFRKQIETLIQIYGEEEQIYLILKQTDNTILNITKTNKDFKYYTNVDIYLGTLKHAFLFLLITQYPNISKDLLIFLANKTLKQYTKQELIQLLDVTNESYNKFQIGQTSFNNKYTKEIISKKLNFNIQEFDITLNTFKKVV
jgi:hypothetical protein